MDTHAYVLRKKLHNDTNFYDSRNAFESDCEHEWFKDKEIIFFKIKKTIAVSFESSCCSKWIILRLCGYAYVYILHGDMNSFYFY